MCTPVAALHHYRLIDLPQIISNSEFHINRGKCPVLLNPKYFVADVRKVDVNGLGGPD